MTTTGPSPTGGRRRLPDLAKLRRHVPTTGSRVVSGSAFLLVVLGVHSSTAALFWFLASRVGASAPVGEASALYTSLQFVNYSTGMGLTVAMARFGTERSADDEVLYGWSLLCTTIASLAGTLAYFAVVHSDANALLADGPGKVWFFALTAATSIGLLVDVRLMARRQWHWLLAKVCLVGLIRLPLVFLDVGIDDARWFFAVIAGPQAAVGLLGVAVLPAVGDGWPRLGRSVILRRAIRFASVNWVASLASQAPQFVLPLVVAVNVSASINANFFLAWSATAVVFLFPATIAQVLLLEQAGGPEEGSNRGRSSRDAMVIAVGVSVAAFVAVTSLSRLLIGALGREYHLFGRLLPVLFGASIPWAVAAIKLTEARVRHDHRATIAITLTQGVAIVGLALALVPRQGADGAAKAWLLGNLAATAVALVLPASGARAMGGRVADAD